MTYVIEGLDPKPFAALFDETDAALAARNIAVVHAEHDDYPCRISLNGVAIGDRLLLLNYEHQPSVSPYRSAHAIYVAQGSNGKGIFRDTIPSIMLTRILSIRAFDVQDMIIDADIIDGSQAESLIKRLLTNSDVAYLHVHFAKRGCFAAKVVRS